MINPVICPVTIAGAGPVGLAIALGLARRGIKPRVLESKTELDLHSRATLLVPRSLAFFERLGVLLEFLAQGERNDAIRILRAGTRKPMLTFDFAPLANRTTTPFALALSQDRTERILLEALRKVGVDVAFGVPFEAFTREPDAVMVRTGSGVIRTKWLIGADGAHSGVRGQLGWQLEGKTYPGRAALADVRIDAAHDTRDGWLVDPQAASFTLAIRFGCGTWRIIEAAVPDDVADADLPARARDITERLFGAGSWRETVWTAAYRKHERRAMRYRDGRVVLAGDAAHLNSPAGGQGMNAGLADADALVEALVAALDNPGAADARLDDYAALRIHAFDHEVRSLTNGLEAMETAPAWVRDLAFSALGLARAAGIEAFVARKLAMLAN